MLVTIQAVESAHLQDEGASLRRELGTVGTTSPLFDAEKAGMGMEAREGGEAQRVRTCSSSREVSGILLLLLLLCLLVVITLACFLRL